MRFRIGLVLLVATLCSSARGAAPDEPRPAAVLHGGQELFQVKTRVGSFPPEARAKAISERLERISSDPFRSIPNLVASDHESSTDLFCDEIILMTVTDEDALAEGLSRTAVVQARMASLQSALQNGTWLPKLKAIGLATLWTLLVTLGGIAVLWVVRQAGLRVRCRIQALPEASFPALQVQNLELLSNATLRALALRVAAVIQGAVLLILGYLYLSFIFSFFPATRGLASRLFQLILGPIQLSFRAILGYLPSLFFLLLIALATRYLLKLIRLVFKGIQSGALQLHNFHPDWADPTYRLVRFFVFAFALVMAFPYLPGSGSEAFKGVSIFFGIVFSLGSSGAVGNAVAGIMITYMRPFQVGDRIAVGETVGDVVEKSLLVTRLRTVKNIDVTIPNSTLLGAQVQNFSAQAEKEGLILHTTVTIGYDAPWRTVHALLIEAAGATEGILAEPAPFVLQTSLDDFYVSYQINAYTRQASRQSSLYSELHANIQEKFNEAGVEIMSPHYRSARDGNATTIPTQHLPEGYVAPSFRIKKD